MSKASDQDRANCRLFAELVRHRNPKAKIPDAGSGAFTEWLRSMRLLRERDDEDAADIADLIRWLFTDPHRDAMFWATTIQAPSGLRSHYAQVHAKMLAARGTANGNGKPESSAELLARKGLR